MAAAVDASDIVFTAQRIHKTTPAATAALGRLLCAGSLMGASLKQDKARLNLKISAGGPIGNITVVADSKGNVRGYVGNNNCPTEYYENGKINVSAGVGKSGTLAVIRDYGSGEPYIGQVPVVSGEIAEDIASYYAVSEQIPTVCALGVLVDKEDAKVLLAGGLLVQLLPGADDGTIDRLEENIAQMEPVTAMLSKGMDILDICKTALKGFELEVLSQQPVNYVCSCSREKIEGYFMGLPQDEIMECLDETGNARAHCQFCGKTYIFTGEDLQGIIREKNKNKNKSK